MQAAVSEEYFLEKGLAEFNSTAIKPLEMRS